LRYFCADDKDPLHTEPPDNPANEKAAKTLRQVERGIRQHYPGTRPAQRFLKGTDKKPEGIKTAATVNEEVEASNGFEYRVASMVRSPIVNRFAIQVDAG